MRMVPVERRDLRRLAALVAALALVGIPASARAAFPGSNGKIAFVSTRDGGWPDVYVMSSDGSGVTRLTSSPGFDVAPAWSPDGSKIVFASDRDNIVIGPAAVATKIYVMNADGSAQTRITDGTTVDANPSWSPDGTQIVFSRAVRTCTPAPGGGEICDFPYQLSVMNSDGSGLTQLTDSGRNLGAVWSPAGDRIAFHSTRPDPLQLGAENTDVYSIAPDGSAEARLTTNAAVDEAPDWSPSAGKIAFDRALSDIYLMNPDGSQQALLTTGVTPVWSPDGRKLAFTVRAANDDVYVANADGSGSVNVTNNPAIDGSPDWAPRAGNAPPDCTGVSATPAVLSPANHKLVPVTLTGATDPDGDEVILTVTAVTQDEPLVGPGDNTAPDAAPQATPHQVGLRAERSSQGDGRVYQIAFTASDGAAQCSETISVGVPRRSGAPAVDSSPPSYDSFGF
jgi:TolB protein